MSSADDGRRRSLTPELFGLVASFLGPRDQHSLALTSKAVASEVHKTNPSLRQIKASATVGDLELFHVPNPHAPNTRSFHPFSSTGVRAEYPHLTVQASGTHFTDLTNPTGAQLSQVRHDLLPSGALGPQKSVPAKDGNLFPSTVPNAFVRKKDLNKDLAGTLSPKFREPVSPRSQRRADTKPDYTGKPVTFHKFP